MAFFDCISKFLKCISNSKTEPISNSASSPVKSKVTSSASSQKEKLPYADKELIMVKRVTIDDMKALTNSPYIWNSPVEKFIVSDGHPFAYINLIGPNVNIAKQELEYMNTLLYDAAKVSPFISQRISIPIAEIVFTPQKDYGHTRLICTPHTFDGRPSKYPVSLSFMTDLSKMSVSTHGDLFYGQTGTVEKAQIYCWRDNGSHFYYFTTVDGVLVLEKFERNGELVYKAPHILQRELRLEQELHDFQWLQSNLPDVCPKSISGFRRMKTQNTKNYQTLKALAAEKGREI